MIKKVPVAALTPGMFLHDLNCGWMEHPFLRSRFLIASEDQIIKIADAGIREVYIDTRRGYDVADAPTETEVRSEIDRQIFEALHGKNAGPRSQSAGDELQRAVRVRDEAAAVVRTMMARVRSGETVSLDQAEPVVERITGSILRNSGALLSLCRVKSKDDYTFQHSVSVCALMVAFARSMGLDGDTVRECGIGGLLHDLGKLSVPDAILSKPGRLTEEEFALMKRHPLESFRLLSVTEGIPQAALAIAGEHHERFDGSGYPRGIKGEAITRAGQMAAICDVYDAITSDRCYHKGMTPTEALRKIFEWGKFHFNPELVHAFLRCIGIYPVGSLVMLESGRLAVVIAPREDDLLRPKVRVIFDAKRGYHVRPEDIDLASGVGRGGADRIVGHESPEKWKLDPLRFL